MNRLIVAISIFVPLLVACNGGTGGSSVPASLRALKGAPSSAATPTPMPTLLNVYVADQNGSAAKGESALGAVFKVNASAPSQSAITCAIGTAAPAQTSPLACTLPASITRSNPRGLAVDSKGNVYVADQSAFYNRNYSGFVYKIAKNGVLKVIGCGPNPQLCTYNTPYGVAVDGASPPDVFFTAAASNGTPTVYKFSGSTKNGALTTLPAPPGGWGAGPVAGIAVDPGENVYVAVYGGTQAGIWVIPKGAQSSSQVKEIVSGTGNAGVPLDEPNGVAVWVDKHGRTDLFVADTNHNAVKEVMHLNTTTWTYAKMACVPRIVTGPPGTLCVSTKGDFPGWGGFQKPHGVAVDAKGDVYVADSNHSAIKMVTPFNGGPKQTIYCITPNSTLPCNGTNIKNVKTTPGSAGFFLPNAVASYGTAP